MPVSAEKVGLALEARKPRILLVEDEALLREHLAASLADEYLVETAGSGTEALRAVMHEKPDLIVTDIVMPEMDGVEFLRTLRSVPSTQGIPVLLISGHAPEARRIEGFQEGADCYLAKPYSEIELRAIMGAMLESHIHEGSQPLATDLSQLRYGVSVTDPCIDWETTERCLTGAAEGLAPSRIVTGAIAQD